MGRMGRMGGMRLIVTEFDGAKLPLGAPEVFAARGVVQLEEFQGCCRLLTGNMAAHQVKGVFLHFWVQLKAGAGPPSVLIIGTT